MPRAELLHLHRDVAEPAVNRHQPGGQIPFAVALRGFPHGGGTLRIRREVRRLRANPTGAVVFMVVVVSAVEPQHRPRSLVDVWRVALPAHYNPCSAFSFSAACCLRFSSTSTCHFSLAAVVSISISNRSVISGVTSATST